MRSLESLSLFLVLAPRFILSTEICACQFTVDPSQEEGCRVYGQLGDGNLIPWYRANQTCLDTLNIKVRAIDLDTLYQMCPFSNSTGVDITAFVNFLRFDTGPAANAVKSYYPDFFEEKNSVYVLNEQCQQDTATCWSTIKNYFIYNADQVTKVCAELHDREANSLELEQSTARIQLCQKGGNIAVCEPLSSQLQGYIGSYPNKACSAFGLGPASADLPDRNTCTYDNSEKTARNNSRASTRGVHMSMGFFLAFTILRL